jgi:DNA-binding CsgD family transcriptional regulator
MTTEYLNLVNEPQVTEIYKLLESLSINQFFMFIKFNDGTSFGISTLCNHKNAQTSNKFGEKFTILRGDSSFISDKTDSSSDSYHILRPHVECNFEFYAPRRVSTTMSSRVLSNKDKKFEELCILFSDTFMELIRDYNSYYRFSFILTSKRLRDAVIRQGYKEEITLTKREQECIWLSMQGKSAKEIGQTLNISYQTVQKHLSNIRVLFNEQSLRAIIYECINRGIIGKVGFFGIKKEFNQLENLSKGQSFN